MYVWAVVLLSLANNFGILIAMVLTISVLIERKTTLRQLFLLTALWCLNLACLRFLFGLGTG